MLIYPTETFLALGCRYDAQDAVAAISQVKGRALSQPQSLICASMEQVQELVDPAHIPGELAARFWPGPLTLVLPPRQPAPPGLANGQGRIALRVTSCPDAAPLAAACGPLTASSANIHGRPPVQDCSGLDGELLRRLGEIHLPFGLFKGNFSGGVKREPSTIVEPERVGARWRLRFLREGAIPARELVIL